LSYFVIAIAIAIVIAIVIVIATVIVFRLFRPAFLRRGPFLWNVLFIAVKRCPGRTHDSMVEGDC